MMLGSLLLVPVPAQGPASDEQSNVETDPASGYFFYAGGPVRGKRARTQTDSWTLQESSRWVTLPGSQLTWVVPAGSTELFNVAFSAECRLFNGGADDWLRIRIIDVTGGVATPLEPYDGQQAFCSADSYATHKGNWVRRAGAGTHTLYVQFWILDGGAAEALSAWIDDWTFELVVYD